MTALEICNVALRLIGANKITALSVPAAGYATCIAGVAEDTITVNGVQFTFKETPSAFSHVPIDTTARQTAQNLCDAVNHAPWDELALAGSASRTVQATMATNGSPVVLFTALTAGTAGNAYTLAVTGTTATRSAATFAGGVASDGSTEAQICDALYPLARDSVLEAARWKFAMAKHQLVEAHWSSPSFGYANRFPLPAETLRVLKVDDGGETWDEAFEVEGRFLHADAAAVDVVTLDRVGDPAKFSPGFVRALTLRLAADLCVHLSENVALAERLEVKYLQALRMARHLDGTQGSAEVKTSSWWASKRGA